MESTSSLLRIVLQRLPAGVSDLVNQSPVATLDGSMLIGSQHTSVFLLDGAGRVRWAGSGEGSKAEVESMIGIARDLMRPSSTTLAARQKQASTPRVGKKVPRN